ncbi:PAS domain-containing sensor histidine kinase [Lysobacter tyrosinilyticus]
MSSEPMSARRPVNTEYPDSVALLDAGHQFQLLVQSVVDYAIYMLDPHGRIVSWNTGGRRIKGYEDAEIIGRHFSIFYTPEDVAAGEPQRALAMAAQSGKYEKEGWRMRKDGTRFWASVVIDPVVDNGKLIGFAKVTRDITDRHQAQQALEEAQRVMLQTQKMEAIGQLTYGLAHDFNNLLTVISNSLDLLDSESTEPDSARTRRAVATARRAADRGALLTKQLLAFSRGQWLLPKSHDINSLISDSAPLLCRACDETVQVDFDLQPKLPMVSIDAPQFEATLLNLVVNARDAMAQGGRIQIRTRLLDTTSGPQVAVTVADAGSGMSPEVLARAAEPFFTTKEVGKGSGLGLSQVYGFIAQSSGKVDIVSEPGTGTAVTLHLPVLADQPRPMTKPPLQVLMVDDDPNIVEIVADTLRDASYEVLTAGDGSSALALLGSHPDIDVLFSDVVLPGGKSGVDLAKAAREQCPGLKIILASGYSESWLEGLPEDCEFLAKPYRAMQVLQLLSGFEAQRRTNASTARH